MKRALLAALLLAAPAGARAEQALRLYCGGGFTGGGGGLMVDGSGSMTRLRMNTFATPLQYLPIEAPPQPVAEWVRLLEQAGFRRLPQGGRYNMTCSLTLGAPQGGHTVSWPGMTTPAGFPPEVHQVVDALRAAQQAYPARQ